MSRSLLQRLVREDGGTALSGKEEAILRLLITGRELYGLQMVTESNGAIGRGTIYVTISRMAAKGLVASRQAELGPEETGLPRRLYRITAEGRRVLAFVQRARSVIQQGGSS